MVEVTSVGVPQPTEQELLAQLQSAITGGNFKVVAKVSAQLVKFQNEREKTELEAKQAAVVQLTIDAKAQFDKLAQKLIDTGKYDAADGFWYVKDFEENLTSLRLLKSVAKAKGEGKVSGGGTGKKYPSTAPGSELWEKHKNDAYKESGMKVEAAHNSNTDKNWRYAIHQFILKAESII